jgi:hypothetical protein
MGAEQPQHPTPGSISLQQDRHPGRIPPQTLQIISNKGLR